MPWPTAPPRWSAYMQGNTSICLRSVAAVSKPEALEKMYALLHERGHTPVAWGPAQADAGEPA
jgi:hypothetical protein